MRKQVACRNTNMLCVTVYTKGNGVDAMQSKKKPINKLRMYNG